MDTVGQKARADRRIDVYRAPKSPGTLQLSVDPESDRPGRSANQTRVPPFPSNPRASEGSEERKRVHIHGQPHAGPGGVGDGERFPRQMTQLGV